MDALSRVMQPKRGDVIVVWFSCGAASAVAARQTIDFYRGFATVRVVNNPVKEEDSDNRRFLADVQDWIGVTIETATNPDYPDNSARSIWEKRKFMSGPHGAQCTELAKRVPRQLWELANHHDWMVFGFTADEVKRDKMFSLTERDNLLPMLIASNTTKNRCYEIVRAAGIELPRLYSLGYPNTNCVGCVKATSPTYWNHVRKHHPDVFADRAEQSRRLGARLVRYHDERMFLDELPPDAKGLPMKSMPAIECGIFCEEKGK